MRVVHVVSSRLQRLQEVDQVLHLLAREANLEALVIKIDELLEISGNSVMEIWRARRQSPEDKTLASADITTLSGD